MELLTTPPAQCITLLGQRLWLLPERVIYWEEQRAFLLADLHLGKAGHFRRHGIPISGETQQQDLDRLCDLLDRLNPAAVYFLGDLFHSEYNREWEAFAQRIDSYQTDFYLVKGNHDLLSTKHYDAAGLQLIPETLELGPFTLRHEPTETSLPGSFSFAGHLHPGIRLAGGGRQSLRLPCFWLGSRQLILPAFGSFTGLYIVQPAPADQVFVIADQRVIPIPFPTNFN